MNLRRIDLVDLAAGLVIIAVVIGIAAQVLSWLVLA